MRSKERAQPNHPVIRWAQPPEAEESRPRIAPAAVREGEIYFQVDEGVPKPARASLGRYRISVRDLLAFLQRFRIAS